MHIMISGVRLDCPRLASRWPEMPTFTQLTNERKSASSAYCLFVTTHPEASRNFKATRYAAANLQLHVRGVFEQGCQSDTTPCKALQCASSVHVWKASRSAQVSIATCTCTDVSVRGTGAESELAPKAYEQAIQGPHRLQVGLHNAAHVRPEILACIYVLPRQYSHSPLINPPATKSFSILAANASSLRRGDWRQDGVPILNQACESLSVNGLHQTRCACKPCITDQRKMQTPLLPA